MKVLTLLINVVLPVLTLINITAALPRADDHARPGFNTSVVLYDDGVSKEAADFICNGEWRDSEMQGLVNWTPIASTSDMWDMLDPALTAFVACVGFAVKGCAGNPWCFLGAIAICGGIAIGYACVVTRCWESKEKAKKTIGGGEQSSGDAFGNLASSNALSELRKGMKLVMDSGNLGSTTTQTFVQSGTLYRASISSSDLYNKISKSFRTCECNSPRCL